MTKIFDDGNMWIETIAVTVSINNGAGQVTGALVDLDKPGLFVGGSLTCTSMLDNDNTQAVSVIELRGLPTGTLGYGIFVNQVRIRVNKQAGTAGATTINAVAVIFLKKG